MTGCPRTTASTWSDGRRWGRQSRHPLSGFTSLCDGRCIGRVSPAHAATEPLRPGNARDGHACRDEKGVSCGTPRSDWQRDPATDPSSSTDPALPPGTPHPAWPISASTAFTVSRPNRWANQGFRQTHLDERLPQGLRLTNLQRHDSVGIETGPHHPVHCRRHRTDDRVANSLRGQELCDVRHQQR